MKLGTVVLFLSLISMAVFPPSGRAQTVKTLYSFNGANSSGNPGLGAIAQGRNGKLYGTTIGPNGADGSIFAITTRGIASQPYTFGSEGANPWAGLTLGTDGYYYGTASTGGASGNGVLFRVSPTGVYTNLHDFAGELTARHLFLRRFRHLTQVFTELHLARTEYRPSTATKRTELLPAS